MIYELLNTPQVRPITLAEAKNYLKVTVEADDTLIALLIDSAVDYVRRVGKYHSGRHEVAEYYTSGTVMKLGVGVAHEVLGVDYWNGSGWTAYPTAAWRANLMGRFVAFDGEDLSVEPAFYARRVRYVVGRDDFSDLPPTLRSVMYMLIGLWYENRADQDIADLRYVDNILMKYQLGRI